MEFFAVYPTLLPPVAAAGLAALVLAAFQVTPAVRRLSTFGLAAFLILTAFFVIAANYTGHGLDASVLFHVYNGFRGLSPATVARLLALALAALALSWGVLRLVNHRRLRMLSSPRFVGFHSTLVPVLILFSAVTHPTVTQSRHLVNAYFNRDVPPLADYLSLPPKTGLRPGRNFVLVYAESLERTYFDRSRFPGLLPRLSALEPGALRFRGIGQAPMTGWTIAGMTASQCGIPLPGFTPQRNVVPEGRFLPGALCLGDLLAGAGYELVYLGGADPAFAGKGDFYREHGFERVYGTDDVQRLASRRLPASEWGVYDQDLFEVAWRQYQQLARGERPFGLVLLTLDTHAPEGFPSPGCVERDIRYQDGRRRLLNAVACQDELLARFIERLLASPQGADTVIMVGSDHLVMGNDAGLDARDATRENWFIAFNAGGGPGEVHREATMLDLAPTILEMIGIPVGSLGLGRSLLRDAPTLTETFGRELFYSYLEGWQAPLWRAWQPDD